MADSARILIGTEWHYRLAPKALYEGEFERIIIDNAEHLCPGFTVIPFKLTVESQEGNARADLALIEKDFRAWYVVEVELGEHGLPHVYPQVRKLANGRYGERHALAINAKAPLLSIDSLQLMMKGEQPKVIVMVNDEQPEWEHWLRPLDASVVAIELYRSIRNEHVLRVIGDMPQTAPPEVLTACRLDRQTSLLVVESPAALGLSDGVAIQTLYGQDMLEWRSRDIKNQVYLLPSRKNPLNANRRYLIVRRGEILEIIQDTDRSLRSPRNGI